MADGNLLDLIIQATEKELTGESPPSPPARRDPREVEAAEKRVAQVAEQIERDRAAAEREAERRAWAEAEQRAVERAAARGPEMCGLAEGARFEVRRCGEEVNGLWVVHRVDPGPAGDPSRSLWAVRASGEPGALRFGERKLLDALHAGLVVRQDDA